MKQKIAFLSIVFCLIYNPSFSQVDKLNRALEFRVSNPALALQIMDSVIQHPLTKNDYYTWTSRAYIYYELYKKTDKLKLFSPLRDSILSSVRQSNQLKPDSESIENNKRMLKTLALGYRKIAKNQLEDSINFERSSMAFNFFKETTLKYDTSYSFLSAEAEFHVARTAVALNFYNKNWEKNNRIDTNEYIFIDNEIKILKEIGKKKPEDYKKELSMSDKNFLKEEKKPLDKDGVLQYASLYQAYLNQNYSQIIKQKYINEATQKQIQLALSIQQNQLAELKAEKQKDEIELLNSNMTISQFQVEEQKKNNQLLENEKQIQKILIEKQKIESKEKEKELRQQRFARNIFIGGIGLLFIIIFLIYRNLALNKKQNKIILEQKHLVEEKHKEITDSINYAERIQRSFLASKELLDENLNRTRSHAELPETISGQAVSASNTEPLKHVQGDSSSYFVFFQPKDVVSGDFYWASTSQWLDERASVGASQWLDERGHLQKKLFYLCTADSTGHGVPGAIMSLLNIASLEKAMEHHSSPAEILNHTRRTIIERLKKDGSKEGGKDGMDCSLIAFDFANLKMTYAAANNPVWVVRDNKLIEFEADRMPVGKHDKDKIAFTEHEVELKRDDVVYTLTDGLPDQFGGERGKKFMYKQLKELLISIAAIPMSEQKTKIETTLKTWMGDNEQVDDVCIIGVRI